MSACDWCADSMFSESAVFEITDAVMRERLTGVEGIEDVENLRYCNVECQKRFHANLRRLSWNEHGPTCACVACLG